jgi:outer membrane protein assembly factor BamB
MVFPNGWRFVEWSYRKGNVISTTGAIGRQLRIIVNFGSGVDTPTDVYCNGHANNDFSDLRFTISGGDLIIYTVNSFVLGVSAVVYIAISDLAQTIYMYYGNPAATDASTLVVDTQQLSHTFNLNPFQAWSSHPGACNLYYNVDFIDVMPSNFFEVWANQPGKTTYAAITAPFAGGISAQDIYALRVNGTIAGSISVAGDACGYVGTHGAPHSLDITAFCTGLENTAVTYNVQVLRVVNLPPAARDFLPSGIYVFGAFDFGIWSTEELDPYVSTCIFTAGDIIQAGPTIAKDGTIYVTSFDFNLYAINPNGTQKWVYTTGSLIIRNVTISKDGTVVYVGGVDKKLYAINSSDGSFKWSFLTGAPIQSSPAIALDGTIYIGSDDFNLYAIYPNGTLRWKFPTGNMVLSSPAIALDGTIYIGSDDAKLYAIFPDGTLKWKIGVAVAAGASGPAVALDGSIYIGDLGGITNARDSAGISEWIALTGFNTGDPVWSSPTIAVDGTIYIGSFDNNLYAIAPGGGILWTYLTGDGIYSSPTVGEDGTIYVGSGDGNTYALNPDGTLKWAAETGILTGDATNSSPAIAQNGTVYIGSDNGCLYAIKDNTPPLYYPQLFFDGTIPSYQTEIKNQDPTPISASIGRKFIPQGSRSYYKNPQG